VQLQEGLEYVQQLRSETSNHEGSWGDVKISTPDSLKSTLQDAWLVVEVCVDFKKKKKKPNKPGRLTYHMVTVCARKPGSEEEGHCSAR
jgi:hypothetical protein